MGLELDYLDGQTPIDEDEKSGLKILTLTTRKELDEFEQLNIQKAVEWTLSKNFKIEQILTEKFMKDIHKKMFGAVWKWAGNFRTTNKNIGVDKFEIAIELKKMLEDVKYWCDNNVFLPDEIAIRFKHRLVKIHLFPNGNGRHSRLAADILIQNVFNLPVFTWGSSNLTEADKTREKYIRCLKEADSGDYNNLIKFARS